MPFEMRNASRAFCMNAKGMTTGKMDPNASKNIPKGTLQIVLGNPSAYGRLWEVALLFAERLEFLRQQVRSY